MIKYSCNVETSWVKPGVVTVEAEVHESLLSPQQQAEGWMELWDEPSKMNYYYNSVSGEVRYNEEKR